MIRRIIIATSIAIVAVDCAPPRVPPPPDVRTVAVFPPNNRTGDPLLVAGASILEKYALRSERVTVPDVLASEARLQLANRGFTVVTPETVDAAVGEHPPESASEAAAIAARNHIEGAVLYIEVRRWETDVPFKPTFVIASVEVSLVDTASGHVVWSINHPSRPVPTNGVVNLGDAYTIAARKLMEELLTPLGPEQAVP